jgi:hypothetical protein
VKPVGEPDAGNPHFQFDERGSETGALPHAQATAPILDSIRADERGCLHSRRVLENERTTPPLKIAAPCATFRSGYLSLQSNKNFWQNEPNSGEIASSSQLRASICCRTRCFSAVFSAGGLVSVLLLPRARRLCCAEGGAPVWWWPTMSYSEDASIDAKVWELLHAAHVFERAGEFDLIHNQRLDGLDNISNQRRKCER